MKRLSIFWACGPLGSSEFCPLFLASLQPARTSGHERASDGDGQDEPARSPSCVASCLLPSAARDPGHGVPSPIPGAVGDSTPGGLRRQQLVRGACRTQIPEPVEGVGAALPVALDLHLGLEVHAGAEQRLELLAGPGPGLLEHRAALADHDPLLRLPLDPDHAPGAAACRRPASSGSSASPSSSSSGSISSAMTAIECGSSSRAIAQQLLAQQLGGEERLGLVGDHAVRVVVRPFGQPRLELADERVDARRRCAPRAARRRRTRRARPSRPRAARRPRRRSARSILFTTRIFGVVDLLHELGDEPVAAPDRRRSPRRACTRRRPRRASRRARSLVRSPSSVRGLWMPGRVEQHDLGVGRGAHAADLACASSAAGRRRSRPSCPTIRLTRVDFPTFGRPTSVTKPERNVTRIDAPATACVAGVDRRRRRRRRRSARRA